MAARTTMPNGTSGARLIHHSSINRRPLASYPSLASLQCPVSPWQLQASHPLAQASPLSTSLPLPTRCLIWVSLVQDSSSLLVWGVSLSLTNHHPSQRCHRRT